MNQSNNADIEYLIEMFQQDLDLLREYGSKPEIDPATRAYLDGFITYVEENKNSQHNYAADFVDYGTKLMGYLSKNGVKSVQISNKALGQIMEVMITPQVLREPLLEQIQKKKAAKKMEDVDHLCQALLELDRKPMNVQKFKQNLAKVAEL